MGESSRSPLMTYGLSVLIVGLLALVVYAGLQYYRRGEAGQAGEAAATPTPAAAQQQAAAQPTPTPAAEGFKVQVRSTRMFWLTSWQEGEKKRGRMLKPDAPEEFEPTAPLNLHYDQRSAEALQVTVNGRPLKAPADTTTWTITKDNYTTVRAVMSLKTKGPHPEARPSRESFRGAGLELYRASNPSSRSFKFQPEF